jgi:hypothetical protein
MRLALLSLLVGCTSYGVVLKDPTGDTTGIGDDPADDSGTTIPSEQTDVNWEGATLVIRTPLSGDFLPYGEDAEFVAVVTDGDGNETDFDDITWSTNRSDTWSLLGRDVMDSGLDVGTHDITASAELPNGDRLASTVGGVLVQSAYAGIYSGNISIDMTYDTYTVSCVGAVTLTVDAYGDAATGDANCLLDLYGYQVDTTYAIELAVDHGALDGTSTADLAIATYDFPTAGEVTEDGTLSGGFSDDVYGYLAVDGLIEATRVTRDVGE